MKKTLSVLLTLMMALSCFAGIGMQALAAPVNGWQFEDFYDEDGDYYGEGYRYYRGGSYVTGFQTINGYRYYFDEYDGRNLRDEYFWDDYDYFYYAKSNGVLATGWQEIYDDSAEDTFWYYFNSSNRAIKGWQKISGTWYYFNNYDYDPYMYSGGIAEINGDTYCFAANGAMLTGWQKVTLWDEEYTTAYNYWCYFNADGKAVRGWKQIGGKWYYFYEEDEPLMYSDGAYYINGKTYGFAKSGAMLTGWQKLDGEWYYFNSNGAARTGWQKIGGSWYYFWSDGTMENRPYPKINGVYYSFYSSGALYTGWVRQNGYWFYFTSNGIARGWQKISGDWYYFRPLADGDVRSMATGWQKIGSYWYYFNSSGTMRTASLKQGGKTYYFYSDGSCKNP